MKNKNIFLLKISFFIISIISLILIILDNILYEELNIEYKLKHINLSKIKPLQIIIFLFIILFYINLILLNKKILC